MKIFTLVITAIHTLSFYLYLVSPADLLGKLIAYFTPNKCHAFVPLDNVAINCTNNEIRSSRLR